jgi:hypothetical protein
VQDPFGRALSDAVRSHVLIAAADRRLARLALISRMPALIPREPRVRDDATITLEKKEGRFVQILREEDADLLVLARLRAEGNMF